jgi:hypothetical protein
MNTWAYILLAFPFYLAINGKLTTYTNLAGGKAPGGATGSW